MSWSALQASDIPRDGSGKDETNKLCFSATYLDLFLEKGVGVAPASTVKVMQQVGEHGTDWSLGAAISGASSLRAMALEALACLSVPLRPCCYTRGVVLGVVSALFSAEAAGVGSVSHERLGAAQAGKRVLTPMMWSPLMSVRRSWFSIGSVPARVASCATSLIWSGGRRTARSCARAALRARAGAERGEPDRSCAAEPAARGRRHARLRADDITHLLEGARDLGAAHNRREREQRERDGREEDRAREAPSPGSRRAAPALPRVRGLPPWRESNLCFLVPGVFGFLG